MSEKKPESNSEQVAPQSSPQQSGIPEQYDEAKAEQKTGQPSHIEAQIVKELGEVLGPEQAHDAAEKAAERILPILQQELYSGPLPHPKHIEQFEKVSPGSADRIFRMAETEQKHKNSIQQKRLDADIADTKRGVTWGGCLFAGLIGCALISAIFTQSAVIPGVFLGSAVIGSIALFVNGRKKKDSQ